MISVSGLAIVKEELTFPDSKDFGYLKIRGHKDSYDVYVFDDLKTKLQKINLKGGCGIYITGNIKKKKPSFLVSNKMWEQKFIEPNPTAISDICIQLSSFTIVDAIDSNELLTVNGLVKVNSPLVKVKEDCYRFKILSESTEKYTVFCRNFIEIKVGDEIFITGKLKRSKPYYLVDNETWTQAYGNIKNYTMFQNAFIELISYTKIKNKASNSPKSLNINDILKIEGFED